MFNILKRPPEPVPLPLKSMSPVIVGAWVVWMVKVPPAPFADRGPVRNEPPSAVRLAKPSPILPPSPDVVPPSASISERFAPWPPIENVLLVL